jgi:RHS repeat-associated protein
MVASGVWHFEAFLFEKAEWIRRHPWPDDPPWDARWPFDKAWVLARDPGIVNCKRAPLPWDVDWRAYAGTYAADGSRVQVTDDAGSRRDHHGLAEEGGGAIRRLHTPGLGERRGTADRFFQEDWLGTTRYLTDAAGQAPSALRFDAYGNETARSGGKDPTAFQYAGAWGYRRDGDLGLDLLHHRWYDPAVGRFLTRDPIRWAGGLNLYGYCGGDPVNGVDPSGLCSHCGYCLLAEVREAFLA